MLQDSENNWTWTENGSNATGWVQDTDGKWYNLAPSGEMRTGWIQNSDGKWYFADSSGTMQTGIVQIQRQQQIILHQVVAAHQVVAQTQAHQVIVLVYQLQRKLQDIHH